MRYLFITIITCALFLFAGSRVQAQEAAISVSPALFEFDVMGGEVFDRTVTVTNNSSQAMPLFLNITDFDAANEYGGIYFYDAGDDENIAASNWIEAKDVNFILSPGESQDVLVTFYIPSEAVIGSHYAALVFETRLPSYYYETDATRVLPNVGVLAMFNVQKYNARSLLALRQVDVLEFGFPQDSTRYSALAGVFRLLQRLHVVQTAYAGDQFPIFDRVPEDLILKIKNNNLFHIRPQGEVKIFNMFSQVVQSETLEQVTVMPSKERNVTVPLLLTNDDSGLFSWGFIGKYKVALDLTIGSGETIKQDFIFWVIPWKIILSTVGLLGMFIYFVLKYKQRISAFMHILLKGSN